MKNRSSWSTPLQFDSYSSYNTIMFDEKQQFPLSNIRNGRYFLPKTPNNFPYFSDLKANRIQIINYPYNLYHRVDLLCNL